MEFKKKQTTKQTSELTKKELIEIVKDTVEKQLLAYDKKQKRAHVASLFGRFIRFLLISAIMVGVTVFFQFFTQSEDGEDNAEIIDDDDTVSI